MTRPAWNSSWLATLAAVGAALTEDGLLVPARAQHAWRGIARDPVHVNDFHATLLHLFGLDHLRLTHRFQGRDFRLTAVGGRVIPELMA